MDIPAEFGHGNKLKRLKSVFDKYNNRVSADDFDAEFSRRKPLMEADFQHIMSPIFHSSNEWAGYLQLLGALIQCGCADIIRDESGRKFYQLKTPPTDKG